MTIGPPPLTGLKVLEFAGLAPGPYAGMLLADAGASVLRIDRAATGVSPLPTGDLLTRHKSSVAVDLKNPAGVAFVRELARHADVIIDPFRPGVIEKLGLGPEPLLAANPRLVYGRLTGFRRDGKYATVAGHDINYLAVSGVLAMLGRKGSKPTPPINLVADFAGGGAVLVNGILLALAARQTSGRGQVVEANMVDGVSHLATFPRFALKTPLGNQPRGENVLDSGCPYYDTYETADGRFMAVGALEPHFYAVLIRGLGLSGQGWEARQINRDSWPEMRCMFEEIFKTKTRTEWEAVFDGTDACCTPVLDYQEMEKEKTAREGDQRPYVALRETPFLAVRPDASDASHGQGPGVKGEGYFGVPLFPGQGGAAALKEWLNWTEGNEFTVKNGGLVLKEKSKL